MIITNFIRGLIIGLGFIIPGVSGGVLATIMGVYDTIIDKLLNIKKDIKNNLLYLLPIILGIISSILIFSKLILYLLNNKLYFISYVFIGLILGSIPYLIKTVNNKCHRYIMFIPFSISLIIGIILYIIEININYNYLNISPFIMFVAGIIYAIGKIVPGISGASLLMLLGVYKYFLNIIANPLSNLTITNLINFIPFIISFGISAIILLKLMHYLFNKHFCLTYSIIIGFVISSSLFIYPGVIKISSLVITILSFLISYNLTTN